MRYIANTRLRVGGGTREIGDEVPEAAMWKAHIREVYLRNRLLSELADDSPAPSVPSRPAPPARAKRA